MREQVLLRLLASEDPRTVSAAIHRARIPPAVLVVLINDRHVVIAAARASVAEDPDVAELVHRARDDAGARLRARDVEHRGARRLAHDVVDPRLPRDSSRARTRDRRRPTPHEPRSPGTGAPGNHDACVEITHAYRLPDFNDFRIGVEDYWASHSASLSRIERHHASAPRVAETAMPEPTEPLGRYLISVMVSSRGTSAPRDLLSGSRVEP